MNGLDWLFWTFAIITGGAAIAVVLSPNVVRMAFYLIISLGSSAGLFFLANADFVGTAQLLVYVGGTLVLLIFGVMLTASGPSTQFKTKPGELVLAGIVAVALLFLLGSSVTTVNWDNVVTATNEGHVLVSRQTVGEGFRPVEEGNTARPLGLAFLGIRTDQDPSHVGQVTKTGYLLPFEIVSVHLLVVLVGAAYLARAKRRIQPQTLVGRGV